MDWPAQKAPWEKPENKHAWTTGQQRSVYHSDWVNVSLVDVTPPHGETFAHHVVTMQQAAICLVLDATRQHTVMMWRHRFASDTWNWEVPGGLVDEGEDPAETARREVLEELGINVTSPKLMVTYEPMIGMCRARHHVFQATATQSVGPVDANEAAEIRWMPVEALPSMVANGQLMSSGALVAVLHYLALGAGV